MGLLEDQIHQREWFYRFDLPDGSVTQARIPDDVAALHEARRLMLDSKVDTHFQGEWEKLRVLDLACHEGFFASHCARRGSREVVGLDVRQENIAGAQLIRDVYGLENLSLLCRDVFDLRPGELGLFDVVLVFGLLYHVENPVGLLRTARSHTGGICIVETQVAPNLSGVMDWGSHRYPMQMVGSFALVDESVEVARDNREANTVAVSLCPSLEALLFTMSAVGFKSVEVLKAPDGMNDQLTIGKRVMVVGQADS